MVVAKKKPVGDVTRTARAKSLLVRLNESGGKRLPVDFDAEGVQALQTLLANGYAGTQKDVVLRAVKEAAKKLSIVAG